MGESKKKMSLDYITINGLDPAVRAKMEDDLRRPGYSGTKSAYITQLCSEALDARTRRSELTTQKDVDSLSAKMDSMQKWLDRIVSELSKSKAENEVYRMLLCEIYGLGEMILSLLTNDQKIMGYFDKGWYDELPMHLSEKMREVKSEYGDA